ncbi:preprotein translocase subunit SecG [Algicella marina]|uniref:Protein-export membrane protein SecG n=1 Tax=Algicella marina TaxID=2683284 RepID=A0A6P1SZX0_9RHOB|nr:preprotein translocase subunit SecG [Algicella marina]QHQ35075.1 preprotein translocase subunit SecG [Algicella marina]
MENIVLTLHLLLALALILSVLLQRSEGGGLGIGGGGGVGSSRPPTSPVAKLTWMLAIGFIITSLALTWISASNNGGRSVIDGLTIEQGEDGTDLLPPALGEDLLPPSAEDAPTPPPSDDAPTTPPPAE